MYYKWQSYDIWRMVPEIWSVTDQIFCHFGPFFTHSLPPPNNPKDQNFEKKKTPWDIIILQMYIINENHMMYSSCATECDRQNYLSFWTIFCQFTPLTTQEIRI